MNFITNTIKEKLEAIGADGLYNESICYTGCQIDDLFKCGRSFRNCVPARNNPEMARNKGVDYWMEAME
ncbi:MAG: hypothetical protein SVO01_00070 [Thermotogota bacterium]|nr:hypothetical protein [Thermotogota bacterium]